MNKGPSSVQDQDTSTIGRMRTHVADLMTRSPWYREKLKAHGVQPNAIRTWADMIALPRTTKEELTLNNDAFLSVPIHSVVDHVATSGSTGTPVPFMLTERDLERLAHNEASSLALAGVTSADVVQITTTMDKRFMAGMAYWLGLRKLGAGIVRTGPGNILGQWETIARCGTTVLIVVPSFLLRMLEDRSLSGGGPPCPSLRKAICIGEPISAADGGPNSMAQRILSLADIELHGTYASTEMATACTEVLPFGGHVVPRDLIHIEVLDDHGNPVPEGAVGEVVATPWDVEAMPLLRFSTGDLCTFRNQPMDDGSSRTLLGPVLGKKEHRMKVKGTTVFPQQVLDAMHAEPDVRSFVVIREQDEYGSDMLRIMLNTSMENLDDLENRLRDRLRVLPIVERATGPSIEALRNDPHKRKPTPFVDRRRMN